MYKKYHVHRLSAVAWRSGHQHHEQRTRVRIPPEYKVYTENIAILLIIIDLIRIVFVFTWEIKASGPIFKEQSVLSKFAQFSTLCKFNQNFRKNANINIFQFFCSIKLNIRKSSKFKLYLILNSHALVLSIHR
jgi:hypothetical protein